MGLRIILINLIFVTAVCAESVFKADIGAALPLQKYGSNENIEQGNGNAGIGPSFSLGLEQYFNTYAGVTGLMHYEHNGVEKGSFNYPTEKTTWRGEKTSSWGHLRFLAGPVLRLPLNSKMAVHWSAYFGYTISFWPVSFQEKPDENLSLTATTAGSLSLGTAIGYRYRIINNVDLYGGFRFLFSRVAVVIQEKEPVTQVISSDRQLDFTISSGVLYLGSAYLF